MGWAKTSAILSGFLTLGASEPLGWALGLWTLGTPARPALVGL